MRINKSIIFGLGFISGAISGGVAVYLHMKNKKEKELAEAREYYKNFYKPKKHTIPEEEIYIIMDEEEEAKMDFEIQKEKEFLAKQVEDYYNYNGVMTASGRDELYNKPDPETLLAESEHPEEDAEPVDTERIYRIAEEKEDEEHWKYMNLEEERMPTVITKDEFDAIEYAQWDKELLNYDKIGGDFYGEDGDVIVDPYILLGENNIDGEDNVFDKTPIDDYVYVRNFGIGVDYMIHIGEIRDEDPSWQ